MESCFRLHTFSSSEQRAAFLGVRREWQPSYSSSDHTSKDKIWAKTRAESPSHCHIIIIIMVRKAFARDSIVITNSHQAATLQRGCKRFPRTNTVLIHFLACGMRDPRYHSSGESLFFEQSSFVSDGTAPLPPLHKSRCAR